MNSDDLTRKVANDDEDKDTQPTITAVFRLIQDVEKRLIARIEEGESRLTARLEEVESRLTSKIEAVDTRVTELNTRVTELNTRVTELNTRVIEGFKDLSHKMNALNRRILQSEADQEDLRERVERLETKAS